MSGSRVSATASNSGPQLCASNKLFDPTSRQQRFILLLSLPKNALQSIARCRLPQTLTPQAFRVVFLSRTRCGALHPLIGLQRLEYSGPCCCDATSLLSNKVVNLAALMTPQGICGWLPCAF